MTTYEPSVATSEPQTFLNYYVDGLYGSNCAVRIANYAKANNLQISLVNLRCACYGICNPPPLTPNPGAVAWSIAQVQAANNDVIASVLNSFQEIAVLIVTTCLAAMLGLFG